MDYLFILKIGENFCEVSPSRGVVKDFQDVVFVLFCILDHSIR